MGYSQLNLRLKKSTWKERWGSYFGAYNRFRVSGRSMLPTLKEGDIIFTEKIAQLKLGDVVVAKHPFKDQVIVKQIQDASASGYELTGINTEESTDSRKLGLFKNEAILGKVVSIKKTK